MITKLQSINYTENALLYCEKGGELLTANKCFGNANDIYKQMKQKEDMNDRCTKKSFHIKMRAAPEDKGKLTNQDWIDIAKQYAVKIGFEKNMFAVYIHEPNTEKEHIHIVSSRIGDTNLAVPNNFTHYKSQDFSRTIEKQYDLRTVNRKLEKLKINQEFIPNNKYVSNFKEAIFSAINMSDSMEDVVFHLKNQNIKTKIGRGITFIDAKGIHKKGSEIDRKLSLKGIEKLLSYESQEKELLRKEVMHKNTIEKQQEKTIQNTYKSISR